MKVLILLTLMTSFTANAQQVMFQSNSFAVLDVKRVRMPAPSQDLIKLGQYLSQYKEYTVTLCDSTQAQKSESILKTLEYGMLNRNLELKIRYIEDMGKPHCILDAVLVK